MTCAREINIFRGRSSGALREEHGQRVSPQVGRARSGRTQVRSQGVARPPAVLQSQRNEAAARFGRSVVDKRKHEGEQTVAREQVRVLVGTFFRASPLWTLYMRWNGARIGRGVYINSLSISDHNMLEFGDGVVIGESVHLSGHTVEGGVVKTGQVRLGRFVTVGLGSMVGIGVDAGEKCQIGALSVVPKHSKLDGGAVYAGAPVKRLDRRMVAS